MSEQPVFQAPGSHDDVELGSSLTPRFDAVGLITAVATDAATGEVLMLAHMNADALARTIETGIATYWSRARQALWIKGETSGNRQRVVDLRIDCDQDAVWLRVDVEGQGAACHRGYRSCFYRSIPIGKPAASTVMVFAETDRIFDPRDVYGQTHNHHHADAAKESGEA
jgi:phosphoribosyl-AMP cyclohydrolase